MSKRSLRIDRHLASMPSEARDIRAWLSRPRQIKAMVRATESCGMPVQGIVGEMVCRFPELTKNNALKQFTGMMIHEVMERQGFRLEKSGVRMPNNPIFTTSSRYAREENMVAEKTAAAEPGLLWRLLDALSPEQKRTALDILKSQLGV